MRLGPGALGLGLPLPLPGLLRVPGRTGRRSGSRRLSGPRSLLKEALRSLLGGMGRPLGLLAVAGALLGIHVQNLAHRPDDGDNLGDPGSWDAEQQPDPDPVLPAVGTSRGPGRAVWRDSPPGAKAIIIAVGIIAVWILLAAILLAAALRAPVPGAVAVRHGPPPSAKWH